MFPDNYNFLCFSALISGTCDLFDRCVLHFWQIFVTEGGAEDGSNKDDSDILGVTQGAHGRTWSWVFGHCRRMDDCEIING